MGFGVRIMPGFGCAYRDGEFAPALAPELHVFTWVRDELVSQREWDHSVTARLWGQAGDVRQGAPATLAGR